MAGVSTQFSIQDKMTSRLNSIASQTERLNSAFMTADVLSDRVGSADFSSLVNGVNSIAESLDNMNRRTKDQEDKVGVPKTN